MTSMENFAWYRFDAHHVSLCAQCGKAYRPQRSDSKFCSDTCRQRAHRTRLVVTKRDVPGTPSSAEVFRYVRHADVQRFRAEGWEPLPALDGTRHGEYSVLMRRGRR